MARRARARPVLFERAGLCPGLGFWRLGHSRRAPGLRRSRPHSPRCAGKAAVPCSPGLPCLVFCPACVFSRDVTVCSAASHKGVALLIGLWFGFGCLSLRFTLPQGEPHPKAGCQSGVYPGFSQKSARVCFVSAAWGTLMPEPACSASKSDVLYVF